MSHTSTDGAALLRAIIDNPEEDTPRLMYADWLEEEGDESNIARAELIRIQVTETEKARERPPQRIGISRNVFGREQNLLHQYGGDRPGGWWADLPKMDGVRFSNATDLNRFDRGFPWQVFASDVDAFLGAAPVIFDTAPVTYLHLSNLEIDTARKLAAAPHLGRIRQWQVHGRRTDKMFAEIGKSEHLINLREIDFSYAQVTPAGLRSLLFARSLRAMTRLTFAACELGDEGAEVIAYSPACASLERLDLSHHPLTKTGARALAGSPLRRTIRSLCLSQTDLDSDAALAIAGAEWPRLQYLELEGNRITDHGAGAFLDAPFWRSSQCVVSLRGSYDGNPLSDEMKAKLTEAFGERFRV